jgi:hypothetical protein
MNAMRRPLFLSLPAALLAACASQTPGIQNTGGDAFVLDVAHVSGVAAVESGLAQAQSYCGEHGRLFVLTNSQVGSGSYRMEFRCVAPGNVPPPPVVAAAPPPRPAPARGRRAAPPAEATSTGAPLGFAATLPPVEQGTRPAAAWQPADANILPVNLPIATQPLFAPPAGQSQVATAPPPRRMPPPDDSALVLLPRLESAAVATPQAQAVPGAAPLPAVARQELPATAAPAQAASPAPSLPVITAGQPLPGYGLAVPSPNPLPGAPSSLPPIAGPARTPSFPSGAPSGFPTGTSSFTQGFR